MSAASALIYEVVATNVLLFYFSRSSYSIATVLSIFLFGLGLGSLLVYRYSKKIRRPEIFFGILQILIGLYAFFIFGGLLSIAPKITNYGIIFSGFVLLLLPTIFLGAIFPLAAMCFKNKEKEVIGLVYSVDLIGAISGSLIAGFLLIPNLGNTNTIYIAAGLNIISAIIVLPKKIKALAVVFLFILVILMFFGPKYFQKSSVNTQFFAASEFGEVKVMDNILTIDDRGQCIFNENIDQGVSVIEGQIRKLGDNSKILNIGLGCGGTLKALTKLTSETVDVVEINSVVVDANKQFTNTLDNPQVNLIVDDGLKYLEKTEKRYDAIVMVIDDPQVLISSDLYTTDAFRIYSDKLTENGFFAFLPIRQEPSCIDTFYYSLKEIFPYVYLSEKNSIKMFLASQQKKELPDYLPTHIKEINSIDKNTIQKCYKVKW